MRRGTIVAMGFALPIAALIAFGCDERATPPAPGASPPSRPAPAASAPTAPRDSAPQGVVTAPPSAGPAPADSSGAPTGEESAGCQPKDPKLKPLQLLRFAFASAVERKLPVDKLQIVRPGQRVWAHLTMRNRSGEERCVHVVFRVQGQSRTEVDLDVGESWSWRTWAYATLRPTDTSGQLELEATDDQGKVLVHERLPIVPEPKH
jgi:hypothetical protein